MELSFSPEKIRVLYVDDERSLLDIGKKFLELNGTITVYTAESAFQAFELLKKHSIDVIISDYQMPAMDGIDFLKAVRTTDPDIPFIFFSGKGTKEIVIEAYKHGVDLYIEKRGEPKYLFEDLQHTVTEIVTLKNAERALHESESRYRSLFEGIPLGRYRTAPSGQILDINPAFVRLLGYPNRDMLMAVSVPDLYKNPEERNQWLAQIERDGIVRDFEVQFRTYDGTIIWVRDTGEAVSDNSGRVLYYNGNVEDITGRKRAEEELRSYQFELETQTEELRRTQIALEASLNRYLDLYEFAPLGYFTLTDKALITDVNRAGAAILGVDKNDVINHGLGRFIAGESQDEWDRYFVSVLNDGAKQVCTLMFRLEDGSRFPARLEAIRLASNSGDAGILLALTDITDIRRVEVALHETNEYLNKLIDYTNAPIIVWDPTFVITRFNHAFELLTGMVEQEVIGQSLDILFPEESRDASLALIKETINGERWETVEIPLLAADGTIHTVLWNSANILSEEAELISTIAQGVDITDRKRAERLLRDIITQNPMSIQIIDKDGFTLNVNSAHTSLFGAVPPSDFSIFNDVQLKQKGFGELIERIKHGEVVHFPDTYYNAHDSIYDCPDVPVWVRTVVFPLKDNYGKPEQFVLMHDNITERTRAEEALRASEQRYRDVVEDQTELICRFSPDRRLTFINEAYCNYFRLNREECIGKPHSVVLPPDDVPNMKNHLASLTPENPVALISHRIVMPSGEIRWQRWSDRAIFDKEGNVIEYQSVGRDITRQKETETQLENYKETLEQRVQDRTSELSEINLKLKKEIEERKKIQKKLTLSSNEKDLLLREVHHRVKNNLQLIIGLVDMTKKRAHEPAVVSTLTDIMTKVQTMGSIHTRLYESKRFDKINMKQQVHDLVDMISGFYDHDHLDITTKINCAEIYLPVDQAIPCALALNEILANIHKHAFSGRRNGLVEISSWKKEDNLCFIIRDNGIGLPSGFDIEKSNRLGLKLMRTLVEQQLHGNVQITSKAGTEVMIEFPINQGELNFGTGTGS
jgi:PAS domain S-box-containing protein